MTGLVMLTIAGWLVWGMSALVLFTLAVLIWFSGIPWGAALGISMVLGLLGVSVILMCLGMTVKD